MVAMKDIRVVARERVREPSRSPPERRTGVPATCASLRARPHDRSRLLANPTVIASNSGGLAMSSPKHVGRTGSRWLRTAAAGGLARHRHRSVLRFLRTAGCRAPGSGPHPSSEPRGARLSRPSEAPTVSDRPVNRAPRPGRLRGSLTLALAICRHFVAPGDRQHHAAALLLFLAALALAAPAAAQITEVPGAPQNVTATGGDGVVLLEWDEPPRRLGTYQFRHALGSSVPESTSWLPAERSGTSGYRWERVTGLTNGEAYAFEMRTKVGRNTSPTVSVTATPTAISCLAPNLTGRRQVWTGSVTMGSKHWVGLFIFPGLPICPMARFPMYRSKSGRTTTRSPLRRRFGLSERIRSAPDSIGVSGSAWNSPLPFRGRIPLGPPCL